MAFKNLQQFPADILTTLEVVWIQGGAAGSLNEKQIVTPSNPAGGYDKLYFKSDDRLYSLTSGGVETQIGGGGTVTNIASGNGMNFTAITSTGTVTLGTPSTCTAATTNATSANSHTHQVTGFLTAVPLTYVTSIDNSLQVPAIAGNDGKVLGLAAGVLNWVTNGAGSGASTALDNLSSVAINTSLLPGTTNAIDLGSTTKTFRYVYLGGTADPYYMKLAANTQTATNTITFPNATGVVALTSDIPVVTGYIPYVGGNQDITLIKEADRIIKIGATTTADTAGGNLTIYAGQGKGTAAGGSLSLNGGPTSNTGVGGQASLQGGYGGFTSGTGGITQVFGGSAVGGNSNGGDVYIAGGTKHGSGTNGFIYLEENSIASIGAKLDLSLIASTSKTFTFPNASGTFALAPASGSYVTTDQTAGQTIGVTGARLTKLWATDITVTNAIVGSVTLNAGTVTNATLATALTVNTGAVTLVGNVAGSTLTLGAGASSISGINTGDQDLSAYAPLASPTFSGTQTMTKMVQTRTAMAAQALDGTLGNIFTRTLAASETFTQSGFSTNQCFIVKVKQGAGTTYTVTWFSGVTWITSGGVAPVQTITSNGYTTYGFICTGTNTFDGYLVSTQ